MNSAHLIQTLLWLTTLWLLTACDVDGDLPPCQWNVQIDYTYAPYGTKFDVREYMRTYHHYVFNEQEVLVDTTGIACAPGQVRFDLPPGKYTAVVWTNINGNTLYVPQVQPGVSRMGELTLQRRDANTAPDQLYYAAIPFEVAEGLSYYEATFTDAFARITFHVHWAEGQQPPVEELVDLNIRIDQAPSSLGFTPGQQVQAYRNDVACFLPATVEPTTSHRKSVKCYGGEIETAFVTGRLARSDHILFRLYAGDTPLMKEIDLNRYFNETEMDLAGDCIQEYGIDIKIGDNIIIVTSINMGGWEEGGELGGGWTN